ncbi:MAG: hypothetical protein R3247_05575 [Rhodothermales bacterium]|nr:hypothetical protein [Rhodothermales bacterium]
MIRLLLLLSLGLSLSAAAQDARYPLPEDVATLDGIIRAYYEVVSAPAGVPRQTARDHSLHHPDARAIITGVDSTGRPFIRNMTLAEFHDGMGTGAFFEHEIHRETQRFGNVAHVWSTYAWRSTPDGPAEGRGINSIQLYHDGARWWITAWIYDSERPGNPIPPAFLPED